MSLYKQNFGFAVLGANLNNSATSIQFQSGHNLSLNTAKFFKLTLWNATTYPNPADDPGAEIVTAHYSGTINVYTITRGDEGTTPSAHATNDYGAMVITKGMWDTEVRFVPSVVTAITVDGVWSLPDDVSQVYIRMWGAGGDGGSYRSTGGGRGSVSYGGRGGGGGGYTEGILQVTGNINAVVGRGGVDFANNSIPYNRDTSFGSLVALGGHDGGTDGLGQGGSGGSFTIIGGPGFDPPSSSTLGGPGGSSFGGSSRVGKGGNGGSYDGSGNTSGREDGANGLILVYY